MNRIPHMPGGHPQVFAYVSESHTDASTASTVPERAQANPFGSIRQAVEAATKLAESISDDDPPVFVHVEPGEYDL